MDSQWHSPKGLIGYSDTPFKHTIYTEQCEAEQ